MKVAVYLLGFTWIAVGAFAILYTDDTRAYLKGLLSRVARIWLALIAAVVGLLLLVGAGSTTHAGFIGVIGFLGILKGILLYFNPGGLFQTSQRWMDSLNDQGYRLMGIIALILGTAVISWIK